MHRRFLPFVLVLGIVGNDALAGDPSAPQSRDFRLEGVPVTELQNDCPGFQLRLSANREDLIYEEGEEFELQIQASEACYVHLFNINPQGQVTLLFPNAEQPDNRIPAAKVVHIPDRDSPTRFVARPQFGAEEMLVVASRSPMNLRDRAARLRVVTEPQATGDHQAQQRGVKDFIAETRRTSADGDWQVRHLRVTTAPAGSRSAHVRRPRRFFLGIGLAIYADDWFRNLRAPANDARRTETWFGGPGGYETIALLLNEQATQSSIRAALTRLAAEVRPGDCVVIYWSGHGGRTADTNGDETDGMDEYFVLYDSQRLSPETMLLDDEFFEWTNRLNGCELTLLIDSCYSGGAAKGTEPDSAAVAFDFLDGELRQAKAAGNNRIAMLAASDADQQAWELTDRPLSVMTHFFLEALGDSPQSSLSEVHQQIRGQVESYVREHCDARQTPVLVGSGVDRVYLVPPSGVTRP